MANSTFSVWKIILEDAVAFFDQSFGGERIADNIPFDIDCNVTFYYIEHFLGGSSAIVSAYVRRALHRLSVNI